MRLLICKAIKGLGLSSIQYSFHCNDTVQIFMSNSFCNPVSLAGEAQTDPEFRGFHVSFRMPLPKGIPCSSS